MGERTLGMGKVAGSIPVGSIYFKITSPKIIKYIYVKFSLFEYKKQMNNIIVFHLDDSIKLGGGERQVLYLIDELSKLGIENYLVCRKKSKIHEICMQRNIKIINIPFLFDWDIISSLILYLKIKEIKNKQIILHSHTGKSSSIPLIIKKLFMPKIKIVSHKRVVFPLKNKISVIKYREQDAIISISKAITSQLTNIKIPQSKIHLIPSSIPEELIEKNSFERTLPEKIIIGSLTTLTKNKDPITLIEAAKIVIKKTNNVFFEIAGEGPLMEECINMVEKYNIKDRVILKGYIENNTDFLKNIDIFVLSSKEEGLGSSLIEAMAFGLPLIGTDSGGIPEIIDNGINGFVIPKENPQKLAQAILELISNKELYEKFSKNSLIKVKNYSSSKMALSTLEVYKNVIKNT